MRKVSADELIEWANTHYSEPFPIPSKETLREMEVEGITFEIRTTENGGEYPYINTRGWIRNLS